MSFINHIVLEYGSGILKNLDKERKDPVPFQRNILKRLVSEGAGTVFGADHDFKSIRDEAGFRKNVPIREYNDFQNYIDMILAGGKNILWPGRTKWMAQSSGTSSTKSKYIPITGDNLRKCHFSGMTAMLVSYLESNPSSKMLSGKALTLGGSTAPRTAGKNGLINVGDLSGIMLANSPSITEFRRSPKKETAILGDFNKKVELICKECSSQDITSISGVPSWNLVMLKRVLEYNNARNITEVWPNLELFMHGGISMEPYRTEYLNLIPSQNMHYLENYNASEGYFAFQDDEKDRNMLLLCNNSVYYEFIPLSLYAKALAGEDVETCTIETVRKDVPYAMIISTNSGLWRYSIGDTVMFKSLFPHKIKITGRTKLFINAFGEELMISNAEEAITEACARTGAIIRDFTVAPIFMELDKRGGHQWLIEFTKRPDDIDAFAGILDNAICDRNSDYEAKRKSNVLDRLTLTVLEDGTFMKWLEMKGKVGGQHKVPKLSNDRAIVESILGIASKQALPE